MSKNFVDNDNATVLMGAVEESIANTRIFKGTFDDYNALTPEEKAKYSYVATPKTPGEAITDAVTDGDMRPVTSNAVYGKINDLSKNNIGTGVNLQSYISSPYECPSDGYVYIAGENASGSAPAILYIQSSSNGASIPLVTGAPTGGVRSQLVCFVRKGMKLHTQTGYTGYLIMYYPLV